MYKDFSCNAQNIVTWQKAGLIGALWSPCSNSEMEHEKCSLIMCWSFYWAV